ncbi:MAG: DUF2213 domain-containing protein [Pseudomonadota bacterium]
MTREGFLIAPAKINRTGIQIYLARELGLDGGDKPVKLYRPAEEVFRKETLDSFESQTATDDHPDEDVNSENWARLAKGDVRDVCADGEETAARIIVRDEDQKRKVKEGKAELSCGYSFDLDMTPGTTSKGEAYDGVQRNIIGNHVAIVDRGRAGAGVRIADRQPERARTMKTQRLSIADVKLGDKTIPGFAFDIDLEDAGHIAVRDAYDRHDRGLKDAEAAHKMAVSSLGFEKERADAAEKALCDIAEMGEEGEDSAKGKDAKAKAKDAASMKARIEALLKAKDAEIAKLKALTAPAAIEKLGEERSAVVGDAKIVLGKDFDPKGKTVSQIRIAAVDAAVKDEKTKQLMSAVLGAAEPAKADEASVIKAFDVLVVARKTQAGTSVEDGDDGQDSDLSRHLLGRDGGGDDVRAPRATSAQTYWQREAAMSRRPARDTKIDREAELEE